ncbi:hypothetical protein AB0H82_25820 [Streptomyces sp. NPDC050732]|uniref:hypothetical protein n=1 Tax=Streptomyces sp. NPDC050732 TaxID=3154632 RepID=UPI00341CA0EB
MHAVTACRNWLMVGALTGVCVLTPSVAMAEWGKPGGSNGEVQQESKQENQSLSSRITFKGAMAGSSDAPGSMAPVGDWTPPACWYEPYSADQFAKDTERGYHMVADDPKQPPYARKSVYEFRNTYKDGKYKNYNKDKAGEGSWWVAQRDPDRWMEDAAQKCDKEPFWVKNGEPVNDPNAVDPEILAGLAYNKIKLPDTHVTLAPEDKTKVNLPTWAWLDKAKFKKVSVTAALNAQGINIEATTTARPVALKLEPGTADAETFPSSGECGINEDGSIGEPWARGKSDQTPPCGIKYLRSSGNGSYDLKATITWEVTWKGTGVPGGRLPDGSFGTTQNITVEEVQSINR